MAFGQQPGPPATHHQIQTLTGLIHAAGHADFRDARGPLGLTQRQAGGRFTREEADVLIARLEAEAAEQESGAEIGGAADSAAGARRGEPARDPLRRTGPGSGARRQAMLVAGLAELPAEVLAAELQRRGWIVMEP
jgi:hypothetical protein